MARTAERVIFALIVALLLWYLVDSRQKSDRRHEESEMRCGALDDRITQMGERIERDFTQTVDPQPEPSTPKPVDDMDGVEPYTAAAPL